MMIIINTTSIIINIEYSTYYLDEIAILKKKVELFEASNLRLISEKEETEGIVDLSGVVKDLKKVVRDAKKKEKDDAATIVRLQTTIDNFKVQQVDDDEGVSAVKPTINKKDSVPKLPKNAAVKGKKGKGLVIEDCESADSVSSPECLHQVSKRKRATKKNGRKQAELSPADESSIEGKCFLILTILNF